MIGLSSCGAPFALLLGTRICSPSNGGSPPRLVGRDCKFDDLIADRLRKLRDRPYDLVLIAGSYPLRTKAHFTPLIRAANPANRSRLPDYGLADLTRTETGLCDKSEILEGVRL